MSPGSDPAALRQESVRVSYYLAKFGGHRYSGSGDMVLVCHVISKNHVPKGSRNFMDGSPSWYTTILPGWGVAIGILVMEM